MIPSAFAVTSLCASGVKPFSVPMNVAPLTWSLSTSTRSPPELRAGAMKYCLPFAGGWSDVSSICEIALDFLRMWPVE